MRIIILLLCFYSAFSQNVINFSHLCTKAGNSSTFSNHTKTFYWTISNPQEIDGVTLTIEELLESKKWVTVGKIADLKYSKASFDFSSTKTKPILEFRVTLTCEYETSIKGFGLISEESSFDLEWQIQNLEVLGIDKKEFDIFNNVRTLEIDWIANNDNLELNILKNNNFETHYTIKKGDHVHCTVVNSFSSFGSDDLRFELINSNNFSIHETNINIKISFGSYVPQKNSNYLLFQDLKILNSQESQSPPEAFVFAVPAKTSLLYWQFDQPVNISIAEITKEKTKHFPMEPMEPFYFGKSFGKHYELSEKKEYQFSIINTNYEEWINVNGLFVFEELKKEFFIAYDMRGNDEEDGEQEKEVFFVVEDSKNINWTIDCLEEEKEFRISIFQKKEETNQEYLIFDHTSSEEHEENSFSFNQYGDKHGLIDKETFLNISIHSPKKNIKTNDKQNKSGVKGRLVIHVVPKFPIEINYIQTIIIALVVIGIQILVVFLFFLLLSYFITIKKRSLRQRKERMTYILMENKDYGSFST